MKIFKLKSRAAFTLVEMLMSLGCGSIILAAVVTAGVSLQKSFAAMESYSNTASDQLRVLDYIAMDCRRATALSVSASNQLTVTLPTYYNSSSGNAAYAPSLNNCSASGCTVAYGSGSVTVTYQQSGTNFNRVVTINGGTAQTTTIAKNISSFTVTPTVSASGDNVTCSIMFFPNFLHMAGTGTWWNGTAAPGNGTGANGDWYVIIPASDGSNASSVGDVYYKSAGSFSKIENVKATSVYINTFLRTATARLNNNT